MSSGTQWGPDLGVRDTQAPAGSNVAMAASEDPSEHDIILYDASGNGEVADGTQVNAKVAGVMYPDKRSSVSSSAGLNVIRVWDGYGERMPQKSGDAFTAADACVPAYISAAKEIARSPSASGIGRVIGGLFLKLARNGTDAITWLGPIGQLLARASLDVDNFGFAHYEIVDSAANATISERVIGIVKAPGVVTAVTYTGAAFAADNSDYATGTIAKRGAADAYAAATTIADFDSRAANEGAATAFTPYAWDLSDTAAALRLIPGDVITLVTTKANSGKSLIGSIDVYGKVL